MTRLYVSAKFTPLKVALAILKGFKFNFKCIQIGNTDYNVSIEDISIIQWYVLENKVEMWHIIRIRYHKIELPEIMIFQHLCFKVYDTI